MSARADPCGGRSAMVVPTATAADSNLQTSFVLALMVNELKSGSISSYEQLRSALHCARMLAR